jgi:hypothetical protein
MKAAADTLKTEISEMIRNSDINDPDNTEIHRDVWIIGVILYQLRNVSLNKECRLRKHALLVVNQHYEVPDGGRGDNTENKTFCRSGPHGDGHA